MDMFCYQCEQTMNGISCTTFGNCGLNDLPLSFVLSWYEQKAMAILLTLLLFLENILKLKPVLLKIVCRRLLSQQTERIVRNI